jgi:3'-phosphoadenosine 5'-phosphosulfate synthase
MFLFLFIFSSLWCDTHILFFPCFPTFFSNSFSLFLLSSCPYPYQILYPSITSSFPFFSFRCDYYQHVESEAWVPYSVQNVEPLTARLVTHEGKYATKNFKLFPTVDGKIVSPWHNVPLMADKSKGLYNMVVEIPMYSTAKMEVSKDEVDNPIMQDIKDNRPRYYSYGIPFFNYGLLPQTWEDPTVADPSVGAKGDGDPIDAIEIGSGPLGMGSVVRVKVLGSMELIDEGETDHKIIVLREDDAHFDDVHSMNDLERVKPGVTAMLLDWLKNYKTSDGKPVNRLKQDEPTSVSEAVKIIEEVSGYYNNLISGNMSEAAKAASSKYHLPKR